MRNKVELSGFEQLEQELIRLNHIRFDAVVKNNATQMLNRARKNTSSTPGGTPVDTGEMRLSSSSNLEIVGYSKEYAPHVEYGHRTRNGGYVQGQRFLQKNVDIQSVIYLDDLKKQIKKG